MSELPGFTPDDRVLVIAPHPDDESIATGGLLQVARVAGAAIRVLLVTDGDNNPWPQRWTEKRWRIGPDARARWGARRRSEALAALRTLGVGQDQVRCLGLPDLALTGALMRGAPDVVAILRAELAQFAPTRVILPTLEDRHPDHSALNILLRLALSDRAGAMPKLFVFGVHGTAHAAGELLLTLTEGQRETKRAAIQMHTTQMQLSRRRFVAYARPQEPFHEAPLDPIANPQHPLRGAFDGCGGLRVAIDHAQWHLSLRGLALLLVVDQGDESPLRWRVEVTGAKAGSVLDVAAECPVAQVVISRTATETTFTIPLAARPGSGWIKLGRSVPGLFVFDKFGWQTISTLQPEQSAGVA